MMIPRLVLGLVTLTTLSVTAEAQYRYVDGKGVTKTVQYKLDIPTAYRDAAEWIGPTGIGKPGLSEEARKTKARDDAYRRIGEANEQLRSYGGSAYDAPGRPATPATRSRSKGSSVSQNQPEPPKELPVMCIAGERRVMVTPGHWQIKGECGPGDPGTWSGR